MKKTTMKRDPMQTNAWVMMKMINQTMMLLPKEERHPQMSQIYAAALDQQEE